MSGKSPFFNFASLLIFSCHCKTVTNTVTKPTQAHGAQAQELFRGDLEVPTPQSGQTWPHQKKKRKIVQFKTIFKLYAAALALFRTKPTFVGKQFD